MPSSPDELEPVRNPHFTYHQDQSHFHLRAEGDEAIFEAIADVPFAVKQEGWMPWVRAISAPIDQLKPSRNRADGVELEDWVAVIPPGPLSVRFDVDFISPDLVGQVDHASRWSVLWHSVALQVTVSFTHPRVAALWWFHFH